MSANSTGPSHYRRGSIEVWDFIHDQGLNYFLGNAIKYVCRAGYKESKEEDLKKAIHYLQKELELHQAHSPNAPYPATDRITVQSTQQSTDAPTLVVPDHFVGPTPPYRIPTLAWSTGTDIQDSDGFSLGDAG
jgi:hypothetical protein